MITDDILCSPNIREKSVLECLYRIREIGVRTNRLRDKKVSIFNRKRLREISEALQRLEDERSLLINKCIKNLAEMSIIIGGRL